LLNGRDFADTDGVDSSGVALINQAMAQRFWPNQNPIGEHIRPTFHHTDIPWDLDAVPRMLTVIGVVGNIKEFRMTDADYPEFYVSYLQFPSSFMYLVVRGEGSVESLAGPIRTTVQGVDPGQPVSLIQTMEFAVSRSIGEPRFILALLGLFAAVAILLTAAGVYGLTAYSVRQRTKEIGIRMALGANASTVCRMFVRELLIVGGVGIVMGMIVAGGLSGVMANLVYDVSPIDPVIMAASGATLLTVAVVAAAVPARRVAFLDPLITLRCD
jgi:putative ABC transport system permease protein